MNEIPQWVSSLLSAMAGGLLVGLINWRINKTNKEFDERKHIREIKSLEERHFKELMLKAATDSRQQAINFALEASQKGQKCSIMPIEADLIYFIKIADIFLSDKLTKDNLAQKLKEIHEFTDIAQKEINEYNKK